VLQNAEIREGDVVLDVGAGNGLIGFGALELVGSSGRVIFSDVSEDLLDECRRIADELGAADRCEFLLASADDLPLSDASVDVATARSVLIYLMDKRPAFIELHRVLRPGGRLSIFEPINIFGNETFRKRYWGLDVSPVEHLAAKVRARWKQPHEHPLLNFDERDLLRFAEETGFGEIRMDYRAEIKQEPHFATSFEMLMRFSGNPLDPTLGEELRAALDDDERAGARRVGVELRPLSRLPAADLVLHLPPLPPARRRGRVPPQPRRRRLHALGADQLEDDEGPVHRRQRRPRARPLRHPRPRRLPGELLRADDPDARRRERPLRRQREDLRLRVTGLQGCGLPLRRRLRRRPQDARVPRASV
jgi:arsenite methyltransferase